MRHRQAMVFEAPDQVRLLDEPTPQPGPRQLLVETTRTLISTGTELTALSGNFSDATHWAQWVKYPFRPGYLNVGRVIAVGPEVKGWSVGDRAASRAHHASHVLLSASADGASTAPAAVPVPEAVSDEAAAWMGLGKITQVGIRAAKPQLGDVVVVIGLGLLGQLVVQYAQATGAGPIIAIDTSASRLALAEKHGATRTLHMPADQALAAVRQLSGDQGADTVFDVTGHPAVLPAALPLARPMGQVILLGDAGSPHLQHLTYDVICRGVRIVGAFDEHPPAAPTPFARWSSHEMSALFLDFLARGRLRVDDLVTHHYRPADAPAAYAMLKRDRSAAMGVVFDWQ